MLTLGVAFDRGDDVDIARQLLAIAERVRRLPAAKANVFIRVGSELLDGLERV